MMRWTFGVLTVLAITGGMGARAATFSVGVEDVRYLPVYSYEDGEYKGFARAILDAFAKDEGYDFDYRPFPVVRLFNEFVAGDVDFKFPDNTMWSAELKRGHIVAYSDPVVAYIDGVSVLPVNKNKGVDAIKTLGAVRGFTAWDWMDRIKAGAVELHENNSFDALLRTTIAGRNDGAYGSVAVVNYQLDHVLREPGALVYDPTLPHTMSHYALSSIKHPEIIKRFNAWMSANADRIATLKAGYGVEKGIE